MRLEYGGEGIDVANIVLDHQDFASVQRRVAVQRLGDQRLLRFGQVRHDLMQEQRHFIQQPFGRLRPLDDDRLAVPPQPHLLFLGEVAPGVDDDGRKADGFVGAQPLQQVEAGCIGQVEVQHHAIKGFAAKQFETSRGGMRFHCFDIA